MAMASPDGYGDQKASVPSETTFNMLVDLETHVDASYDLVLQLDNFILGDRPTDPHPEAIDEPGFNAKLRRSLNKARQVREALELVRSYLV